jgi:hypothetical protein
VGIQLQITDAVAADGAIAACSGLSADVAIDNRTASNGGTPGTTTTLLTCTSADVARRDIHFESLSNELNGFDCPAGSWTVRVNITAFNANIMWTDLWICRVNSSGVSQQTIASTNTGNQLMSSNGVKSITLSGVAARSSFGSAEFYLDTWIRKTLARSRVK